MTPLHCAFPNASITCTGSTSNGTSQYSENMQQTVLSTTFALVRSVAVHSMKMSRVSNEICQGKVQGERFRMDQIHGKGEDSSSK